MSKLVVIIQCDTVTRRCSGVNCTWAFYNRTGKFSDYPFDTQYMSMTCGGCCGAAVPVKLEMLTHKLKRLEKNKDDVVHLSTCMVTETKHHLPCPFLHLIKAQGEHKGFAVRLGTRISESAQKKRDAGIYKQWEE
ncbi:MAG: CGGC domain-containing protein [Pyramidobacter sp.]|uniref:CGGC domain-containing protein n=1 Tax=Pyramidobacter sp. TaxID=1943581 RepID=UPI002A83AD1B|nr:CGGC domain-containing protein [Pyramidobacter sp.]MDY4031797.1 CGGC domain-containing protein [Pyramidobacter sp.]